MVDLSYHEHAFSACRALHIANALNSSTTFPLLEKFFETQVTVVSFMRERRKNSIFLQVGNKIRCKYSGFFYSR